LDRCQAGFEKGAGADNGVETYMQTLEDGGDEELVFFLGDWIREPLQITST
jgi:hypothetical protein